MKKEKSSAAWIMQWAGRHKSLYAVRRSACDFECIVQADTVFHYR